jgi:CelD/BcsL family acetyltransferase involved in cellulose biosynthesis
MKADGPHETSAVFSVFVCFDELGGGCGPIRVHDRKEGFVVEEQICTHTQKLDVPKLEVEIVSDSDRFKSIGGEWDTFVQRASVNHPFLSHTWLSTWWESFGKDKTIHITTLRTGGTLIAAAPMMRMRTRMYGMNVDAITSIYNAHTPRFDFIVASDALRDVSYRRIWRELSATGCDLVLLKQVPLPSDTLSALEQLAQKDQWLSGRWTARSSPYIPLGCSHAEMLAKLKGGYRYNLRKRYERLGKLGPIDVEVIKDEANLAEAIQDGLRIEAAAWKGSEGTAILSDRDVTTFYARLAEREAGRGNLRLSFLRVGGKRISFSYILQHHKTIYGVKIGYDPEYHAYSPGNMLLNLILQEACEWGCEEYDFLGADDEWKFDWTSQAREHQWLFLFSNRLRPRLLHKIKFNVLPKVKPCIFRLGRVSVQRTS